MNQKEKFQNQKINGLGMYFDPRVAREFAEREENEKYKRVSAVLNRILSEEIKDKDKHLDVLVLVKK